MSYNNLMSHLGFSTNLQDYTASIAFRDTGESSSTKRSEDDKHFSDFMDSLKESNDTWDKKDVKEKPEMAEKKDVTSSSETKEKPDVGTASDKTVSAKEKPDTTDQSSAAKDSDSTSSETGDVKVKDEAPVKEAQGEAKSGAEGAVANAEGADAAEGTPIPLQKIAINPDQSIDLTLLNVLGMSEGVDVVTISPEEMSSILSGLSEKLAALINEALAGMADDSGEGEVASVQGGDVAMVQTAEGGETEQASSLIELLVVLLGQVSDNPELQEAAARVQSGEDVDLTEVLASLSPEEMEALREELSAFLSGQMTNEEQVELIGLLAQHYPAALPVTPQTSREAPVVVAQVDDASGAQKTAPVEAGNTKPTDAPVQETGKIDMKAAPVESAGTEKIAADVPKEQVAVKATMDGVKGDETVQVRADGDAPAKTYTPNANVGAGERFLQTNNAAQAVAAVDGNATLMQGGLGTATSAQAQSSAVGSLSSASGQAQTTGHTHPATQLVSMTMQKAIKAGEETTIKLKLTPPELGRVDVKMSIDQDSTTKIVLTVEKADTHALLQRDAQLLERAMSDAGLDAGGNLSFELAEDGQAFDKGEASEDFAGGDSAEDGGVEVENAIITQSSTMDWYIDPSTGQTHYSILT